MAYTDEQIIDALQKTEGNQAAAARALGCSRTTIHNRIKDSTDVREAYNEVNEANLDKAENRLMHLVDNPEHRDHFKALRFYLRTKGRTRDYGDKLDVTSKGESIQGSPIIINSQGEMPEVE